ncbi:MAG: hypothetical protein KKD05_02725 [Candidatus Omnitrophica bacterium]|nr:hypothetical protein [Candidatus Omnitrophota bacterium]
MVPNNNTHKDKLYTVLLTEQLLDYYQFIQQSIDKIAKVVAKEYGVRQFVNSLDLDPRTGSKGFNLEGILCAAQVL